MLTFKPSSMSLKCEQGPVAIRVLDLCPPTRALFFKVDFTRDQFLYGDYETLGNAFSHIEALPVRILV